MKYESPNERLKDFVKNIKTYFDQEQNTIIYDKRNIIKIVEFEGKKYVVKSFKIPHLLNQIVYKFFRDSKAKRSYENSLKLINLEINTPKPIGYIEFPAPFRFKESFYISEFFDYDFEIRAVFKDSHFKNRENILKKFIEFTYQLHNKGIYHIDYSPGNILVRKTFSSYEFYIIDVNRMKFLELDFDLRMKSMSKLTKDRVDNDLMAEYYAKVSQLNNQKLKDKLKFYIEAEEKYLKNKKRLKW